MTRTQNGRIDGWNLLKYKKCNSFRLKLPHRIHGAAIYGNIYHEYTPNVSIYTSTMDPMATWSYIIFVGTSPPFSASRRRLMSKLHPTNQAVSSLRGDLPVGPCAKGTIEVGISASLQWCNLVQYISVSCTLR